MKERPILFSAPMVKALLAGTKTQTRRIVGIDTLKRSDTPGYDWTWRGQAPIRSIAQQRRHPRGCWQDATESDLLRLCPYGVLGDRLWVREAFTHITGNGIRVHYRADGEPTDREGRVLLTEPGLRRWSSSIHMPRRASRMTLEITEVRVQRLHDITDEDARAEGVEPFFARFPTSGRDQRLCTGELASAAEYRASYAVLWDGINGSRRRLKENLETGEMHAVIDTSSRWAANPWIWALTFKRHEEEPCAK